MSGVEIYKDMTSEQIRAAFDNKLDELLEAAEMLKALRKVYGTSPDSLGDEVMSDYEMDFMIKAYETCDADSSFLKAQEKEDNAGVPRNG